MADLGRRPHGEDPAEETKSQHPVDILLRPIIAENRPANAPEIALIIERMATVPFPTAARHLRQRMAEGQWSENIREDDYLNDLRLAIRHPDVRLIAYRRRGGAIAAVLTGTTQLMPPAHLGSVPLPLLFIVYSADRGIIVTGYQVSTLNEVSLPEDTLWLR